MPTTRRQAAEEEKKGQDVKIGEKHRMDEMKEESSEPEGPPTKKGKAGSTRPKPANGTISSGANAQTGTIERGHIYFFYRTKVQHERADSIDDVKNLHMLLVPAPPQFGSHEDATAATTKTETKHEQGEDDEMTLLAGGADAIPSHAKVDEVKTKFRLITIGRKKLPDPAIGGAGKGRKETFWAAVTAAGDDLLSLERGLGEKTYETKTRGTRHEEPARLVARGVYAIVNNNPRIPSARETHLGYHITHPKDLGDVQEELGIQESSSFILQVKNPLAPASGGQRGLSESRRAKYPAEIMHQVFGKGSRGRESYGLRFASCERIDMLDYEGAELLLIAAKGGEEGLEASLGEGRGEALHKVANKESDESIQQVFRELCLDKSMFPAEALKGEWI